MVQQEILSAQMVNAHWNLPPTCYLFLNSGQPEGHGLFPGSLLHQFIGQPISKLLVEWPKFLPPAGRPAVLVHVHPDLLPRVFYWVWHTSASEPGLTSSHRPVWWNGMGLWPGSSHGGVMMLVITIAGSPQGTHGQGARWTQWCLPRSGPSHQVMAVCWPGLQSGWNIPVSLHGPEVNTL